VKAEWQIWQGMAGSETKLGHKKEAAIAALLSQRSVEDAARACDIPVRTLYRWMKEPEFDAAYRAARRHAYGQSISRLQQGSTAAATTLLKVMVDPATPASTRVRAAEAVLSHAEKAIEIEDIDARLRDLERAAEDSKGNRGR
jgi:transposase-like protein